MASDEPADSLAGLGEFAVIDRLIADRDQPAFVVVGPGVAGVGGCLERREGVGRSIVAGQPAVRDRGVEQPTGRWTTHDPPELPRPGYQRPEHAVEGFSRTLPGRSGGEHASCWSGDSFRTERAVVRLLRRHRAGLCWHRRAISFVLVITIPFGVAALHLAIYSPWPFGRTLVPKPGAGIGSGLANILWLVLFGWWIALGHIPAGIALCVTIIGIPFGIANFKLVPAALWPLGREVVDRSQENCREHGKRETLGPLHF